MYGSKLKIMEEVIVDKIKVNLEEFEKIKRNSEQFEKIKRISLEEEKLAKA